MAVTADAAPAVAFKGRMMTLTVLEIRHSDQSAVARDMASHLQQASGFFRGMPVILSLLETGVDLSALVEVVRNHDMVPVAVLDGDVAAADVAGLGVINSQHMLGAGRGRETHQEQSSQASSRRPQQSSQKPADTTRGAARLINRPVRSGQQIYARGGDLVVTSSVSEGAEVIADGHIHVYGALRGRALAGAAGDGEGRIFCHRFEPELVAVAGCYKVAEDIDEGVRGRSVQVRLAEGNLLIELQD